LFLFLILLESIGSSAVAGESPFEPYSPDPDRRDLLLSLERQQDSPSVAAKPLGINFGHLKLLPQVDYTLTYTDNAVRAQKNRRADFLSDSVPSVSLNFKPDELVTLDISYAFGWHDYLRDVARDYLSHNASGNLKVHNLFVEGFDLRFAEQYTQTANSDALLNNFVAFTRYETNQPSLHAAYTYNRFTISAAYTQFYTHYFARLDAPNNFTTHTGALECAYAFQPERFVLFGSYAFSSTIKPNDPAHDFITNTFTTGVRGVYSKLQYAVGTGLGMAELVHTPIVGRSGARGPILNASISYQPQRRLQFALGAERRFFASPLSSFSTETNFSASTGIALTDKAKLILQYTRNESDRLDGLALISTAYRGNFELNLNSHAKLTFGAARTRRDSSNGLNQFLIHEISIGGRLSW